MSTLTMIGGQVLIAAAPKEQTTEGGIILSADVKKTASEPGVVLAHGPDVTEPIIKGVTVYLDWSKAMAVRVAGNDAVIIHQEFIKAVIA
jgi:co-chaperonin GroES (HSP10)|tara:strand:- start:767 stop:1036 length:270 start_codon:yes stop_codon:yes gene_type:complete